MCKDWTPCSGHLGGSVLRTAATGPQPAKQEEKARHIPIPQTLN